VVREYVSTKGAQASAVQNEAKGNAKLLKDDDIWGNKTERARARARTRCVRHYNVYIFVAHAI